MRNGFHYHTDENISNLAMMIMQKVNKLDPDYLKLMVWHTKSLNIAIKG